MSAGYDLVAKIGADTSGVKRELKTVSRDMNKVSRQLNHNERQWKSWSIRSVAATVAVGMAVSAAARKTVEYADSFQSLTNKLKIATDGSKELTQVTESLFDMANENRASIDTTVDLYAKMERSTRELGFSTNKLLDITNLIGKAFVIGGATSKEMDGAIRQLGQSLSLGALRGEEFNSVAEQAPVLMEAMKSATGKNAGELRKLAATGAITSKILIQSIEAYKEKILGDYSKTQETYGGKMEIARNKAIEFVGANEEIKKAVRSAGDAIVYLSENIEGVITGIKIATTIYGTHLVAAIVRATSAKIAHVAVSAKEKAAVISEMKINSANINLVVAETAAKSLNNKAKIASAEASLLSAKGTSSESLATAKLNTLIANQTVLENALTASKQRGVAATAALTAATNVATGAYARAGAAATAMWTAMGGWVTVGAVTAYGLYQLATATSQAETNARNYTKAIENQIARMKELSDVNLAERLHINTTMEAKYTEQLKEKTKALADASKAYATYGVTDARRGDVTKLSEEIKTIRSHLKRVTKLKDANLAEQKTRNEAASTQKQLLIDMDHNAAVAAAEKYLALVEKRARSEIQILEDNKKDTLAATSLIAEDKISKIKKDINYEGNKAKDIKEIKAKLAADLIAIEANTAKAINDIKESSKEDKATLKEAAALKKESAENVARERINTLTESLKTEREILQDDYNKKWLMFLQDSALLEMGTAERNKVFRELAAQHKEKMDEITGKDTIVEFQAETIGILEALGLRHTSIEEQQIEANARELAILDQQYEAKKLKTEEYEKAKAEIERKSEELKRKRTLQNVKEGFQVMAKNSKTVNSMLKKAAILRAVVAGKTAAVEAWEAGMSTGGPYAPIVAAAYTAASIANTASMISSIKGGGSSMGGSSGGSVPSTSSGSTTSTAPVQQTQQEPARTVNLSLTGNSRFTTEEVRGLFEQFNDAIGDGMQLNVTTG